MTWLPIAKFTIKSVFLLTQASTLYGIKKAKYASRELIKRILLFKIKKMKK
jgi:hypothetical protein